MRVVVDASVAAKWFLVEEGAEAAGRLLTSAYEKIAPELLWLEVVATLRKRVRNREISREAFRAAVASMVEWNITARSMRPLLGPAADLALLLDHAVYDCLYLALAEQFRCPVVTADRRLHEKVERSMFAGLTVWIGEVP